MSQKKQNEQEIEQNELMSWADRQLGHLKPYWSHIALGICVLFLGGLGLTYFLDKARANEAAKCQLLVNAQGLYRISLDDSSLKDVAGEYPDDKIGQWALLFAADAEMRSGLADMSTDKKAGFDKITKARELYEQIVNSTAEKSTMLQRRSIYGLAYAMESSGEFEEASKLYQQIVELGEDTPFFEVASQGLERTTNPVFVKLFTKFKDYEPVPEAAPGVTLPPRPDIQFPEPTVQPDNGGGDFGDTSGSEPGNDGDAAVDGVQMETPDSSQDESGSSDSSTESSDK